MKNILLYPLQAISRVLKRLIQTYKDYRIEYKYQGKTILLLIIALHWIIGYAFITGNQFYDEYISGVSATELRVHGNTYQNKGGENGGQEKVVPGSEEWIEQQWTEAGANWNEVWAVTQGESGWNSDAWNCNTNGSIDSGLYQLNSIHEVPLSCTINTVCATNVAIALWQEQGWIPWVAAKKLGIK